MLLGDVTQGMREAIANLNRHTGEVFEPRHIYACSSAGRRS
ncbi:MAG: glutamate mutase L [Bacillus subtilis]|nr:glutamate mutase L [Bacillus subtilis]